MLKRQINNDCIVFCVCDIEDVIIPSSIERICPYSFNYCYQIQQIEFVKDSKLKIIDDFEFNM